MTEIPTMIEVVRKFMKEHMILSGYNDTCKIYYKKSSFSSSIGSTICSICDKEIGNSIIHFPMPRIKVVGIRSRK